jgi:hypothetical protein
MCVLCTRYALQTRAGSMIAVHVMTVHYLVGPADSVGGNGLAAGAAREKARKP